MANGDNSEFDAFEEQYNNEPHRLIRLLFRFLLRRFGDLDITGAYKSPAPMGHWNAEVIANVPLSTGETILTPPKATLYRNNTVIAGPFNMIPLTGTSYWIIDFQGVFPEPNFVKVDVTFINAQYQQTPKTDFEPVVAP